MDMEMQIEPIVSKDDIWLAARKAADQQRSIYDSNPYPEGTRAHNQFQLFYWQRERELNGEETA